MDSGDELLARCEIVPLYGQFAIGDPEANDVPQWETGDEPVVSNSQLIVVATRSDTDGDVACEVWRCDERPDWVTTKVFEGEIMLSTPRLFIGSFIANDGMTFEVGAGQWRVVVGASPPGAASHLTIALAARR